MPVSHDRPGADPGKMCELFERAGRGELRDPAAVVLAIANESRSIFFKGMESVPWPVAKGIRLKVYVPTIAHQNSRNIWTLFQKSKVEKVSQIKKVQNPSADCVSEPLWLRYREKTAP